MTTKRNVVLGLALTVASVGGVQATGTQASSPALAPVSSALATPSTQGAYGYSPSLYDLSAVGTATPLATVSSASPTVVSSTPSAAQSSSFSGDYNQLRGTSSLANSNYSIAVPFQSQTPGAVAGQTFNGVLMSLAPVGQASTGQQGAATPYPMVALNGAMTVPQSAIASVRYAMANVNPVPVRLMGLENWNRATQEVLPGFTANDFVDFPSNPYAVPEPSTFALAGLAVPVVVLYRRRVRR